MGVCWVVVAGLQATEFHAVELVVQVAAVSQQPSVRVAKVESGTSAPVFAIGSSSAAAGADASAVVGTHMNATATAAAIMNRVLLPGPARFRRFIMDCLLLAKLLSPDARNVQKATVMYAILSIRFMQELRMLNTTLCIFFITITEMTLEN